MNITFCIYQYNDNTNDFNTKHYMYTTMYNKTWLLSLRT